MNAILKYPGSKWRIAKQISNLIPYHHSYVEPFFGSGAVFFNKHPSSIETINDLDDNVVNLFRCIRDNPKILASKVAATPYSRSEYEHAFELDAEDTQDNYEKAAKFLIRCWQGHGFRNDGTKVGWKRDVHGRESMYSLREWYSLPKKILNVAERLRCVQIENRPAIELIQHYNYSDVFMYIDPPYLKSTRLSGRKMYQHEMQDEDHIELLENLKNSKAKIMISGYDSDLYNSILSDWRKINFRSNNDYGSSSNEVIWMNCQ